MLRTFVSAAVVLVLVVGGAVGDEKPAKGKQVTGTFVSFKGGVLTLNIKKKGEAEPQKKEFKIAAETKVVIFDGDEKTELTGKDEDKIAKTKEGTRVRLMLGKNNKVTSVTINPPRKKGK